MCAQQRLSNDSDQPGHPPSLIRVFAVRMKKSWVHSYPLSAQRRCWSNWADAQLIWVFAGRTVILSVLSWGSSFLVFWNPFLFLSFSGSFYFFLSCFTRYILEPILDVEYSFTRILPFLTGYSFTSSLHEVAGDTWVTCHLCMFWFQNEAWFPNKALHMYNGISEQKSDPASNFRSNLAIFKKNVCRFTVASESGTTHVQTW